MSQPPHYLKTCPCLDQATDQHTIFFKTASTKYVTTASHMKTQLKENYLFLLRSELFDQKCDMQL